MAHQKDPLDWKIKRYRSGDDHVQACQKGYAATTPFVNVHHIITITAMADGTIAEDLKNNQPNIEFILKCLKKTKWDINAAGNVVRLPMKEVWRNESTLPTPPGWDGWPCHQVDHPFYNIEVNKRLTDHVWDCSIENAKQCNMRGKSLAAALRESSRLLLSKLKDKGGRNGGTKHCWDSLAALPKPWAPPTTPDKWYHPFSMAETPNFRSPPAKRPASGMAAYLRKMFEIL